MSSQENQEPVVTEAIPKSADTQEPIIQQEPRVNPIVLAKMIAKEHFFVVEKLPVGRLLYVYNKRERIYTREVEPIIKAESQRILGIKIRRRYYLEVEDWLKFNPDTPIAEFNKKPELIAVKNGVLNLKTRELDSGTNRYLITTKIPHNYNPQADKDNNKIVKFIKEVIPEKLVPLVQEWLGQSLYLNITSNRLILILIGEGNNGKSVFIDACSYLLGTNNISNVTLQELAEDKFMSSKLKDKLANFCADMPTKPLKYMGLIKRITTSDWITSQFKNKDPFDWRPIISLMLSCNNAPMIDPSEDSTGTFRRFQPIDFPNTYDTNDPNHPEDKHLREKLFTEENAEGFLLWCLEGLDRLLKNEDYTNRPKVQETRKAYIKKSNSSQAFIDECLKVTDDPNDWFLTDKAYKIYLFYCKIEKLPTQNIRAFSIAIGDFCHGAMKFKTKEGLRGWLYVTVNSDIWKKYQAEQAEKAEVLYFLHNSGNVSKVETSVRTASSALEKPITPYERECVEAKKRLDSNFESDKPLTYYDTIKNQLPSESGEDKQGLIE